MDATLRARKLYVLLSPRTSVLEAREMVLSMSQKLLLLVKHLPTTVALETLLWITWTVLRMTWLSQ